MAEYIEREAALALTHEIQIPEVDYRHRCIDPDAIKELPAADVAPVRHGRWISDHPKRSGSVVRIDADGCPVEVCHCSECGDWLSASDEYPVRGRYCPNCGAQMMDGDA